MKPPGSWWDAVAGGVSGLFGLLIRNPNVPLSGELVHLTQALASAGAPSGSPDKSFGGAVPACLDVETSLLETLVHLEALRSLGLPPSIVGALWTWPPVFRSLAGFFNATNRAVAAFARLKVLGSADLSESAVTAITAVLQVADAFPHGPMRKDEARRLLFDQRLRVAQEAVGFLGRAARHELERSSDKLDRGEEV